VNVNAVSTTPLLLLRRLFKFMNLYVPHLGMKTHNRWFLVQAAEEELIHETDAVTRQNASMSRGGSHRGGKCDVAGKQQHPDGQSVTVAGSTCAELEADGVLRSGKLNAATRMTFVPTGVANGKKGDLDVSADDDPLTHKPTSPIPISNLFSAASTRHNGSGHDSESAEAVERKVKALLNELTMEHFASISDQIIALANKSEKGRDGRTLFQVVELIFEKATDDATFPEMYARLCRKMMEQISPKVQNDGIKDSEGKPFAGGNLFRKYLLNRCQEDFERGWVAKETTAAAAATKATADQAVKEANEKSKGGEKSELYSDEYYAAAKAKRRGLGLIRFVGELFNLQMLTERIMHECVRKFLGNVENPEEEEIESLCKLLTTVGSLLDTRKARAHLDVYFSRMRELTKNKNVNARMVSMLQVCSTIHCAAHDLH